MKILITLKDPDTLYDAISDAVDEQHSTLSDRVREEIKKELRDDTSDWFEYGEYVNLEFDTETHTMKVLRLDELQDK